MKKFPSFCMILVSAFVSASSLSAEDSGALWREMSAKVQNLHYRISGYGPDAGVDFSSHEKDLNGIDEALDALVSAGELESQTVELSFVGQAIEDADDALFPLVEEIATQYGMFVASEMCDLGARMRFITFEADQPLRLHLRLPREELALFTKRLVERGLIEPKAQPSAETGKP